MKLQQLICVLAICLLPFFTSAQGLSYGFKVGLNFSDIHGDLEQDDNGENIERMETNTGFHVGASVRYNFTDRFGLKGDFLFSQKGTQQFYDGQGAQLFYVFGTDNQIGLTGIQERFIRITNYYLELPISAYAKFGKIEIFGGPYVGFLISSRGVGDYQFETATGAIELEAELSYNYLKNGATDAANIILDPEEYETFNFDGESIFYPKQVGAYFDYTSKDGNFFKGIDFGLNAGLAYFLNKGLYVSANVNYGLADLTRETYDRSRGSLNEDETGYAERDDVDRNFTIQASVGFAF